MIDVIIYIWDTIVIRSEEKKLKMMFFFHYLQFSMLVHGPITGVFHAGRFCRMVWSNGIRTGVLPAAF